MWPLFLDNAYMPFSYLSPAELSALRLDGEISAPYTLMGDPDDWRQRSTRIIGLTDYSIVLTCFSAAWALHCSREPIEHTASYLNMKERSFGSKVEFRIEERLLRSSEVMIHNLVGVTTPLRTCLDLLRLNTQTDDTYLAVVKSIQETFHVSSGEIKREILGKHKLPYKHLALKRINLL